MRLNPELRANPEFQSALVRIAIWMFGASYVGLGAVTGYYRVDVDYYFAFFLVYLALFLGMLVSVIRRPRWPGRCYASLTLDITAVSLAIFLTREAISPFYLFYIWIFISAGTRYGRSPLIFASLLSVVAYNLVLLELGEWQKHTFEAIFFLLLLVMLPLYQYSLLRKVREARKEAERANKAKGDFLAVMTHELRTPLTGVLGMADLLKSTNLDAEQRGYVESIVSSAEVLRALVGDVLDMSKIDARKLRLEAIPFDLRATVMDVCSAFSSQATNKALELVVRVDPQITEKVVGDALRVRQILFNLIGNAVKFTETGEVRVNVAPAPADEEAGLPEHILLEVEDTGIGIPPGKLDTVFESFMQAEESTSRRYGGTGLGTTIARDLTVLMDGRIGAESEEGVGSRFWVRLPLRPPEGERRAQRGPRLQGRCALVCEGNASVRSLIADILEAEGMRCRMVEGVSHLSRVTVEDGEIDLLLLADSPQGQDLDALLTLFQRVLGTHVPPLFLTYAARRVEREEGCGPCVNKPFSAEELVASVLELISANRGGADESEGVAGKRSESTEPLTGLTVLVAEDNDIAAKVIVTLLTKQGAAVTRVRDGERALSMAKEVPFALAFIDLRMPRLDGMEFTRAYRETETGSSRLPIVALTADAAEDVKANCLEAGMDDFLGKPVKPEELIAVARRVAAADPSIKGAGS